MSLTFDKEEFLKEMCDDTDALCFNTGDCYDEEGYFDYDRLGDAVMDGEYVPEYWFG